jgi:hypothetical protein
VTAGAKRREPRKGLARPRSGSAPKGALGRLRRSGLEAETELRRRIGVWVAYGRRGVDDLTILRDQEDTDSQQGQRVTSRRDQAAVTRYIRKRDGNRVPGFRDLHWIADNSASANQCLACNAGCVGFASPFLGPRA